jgi:hypothetical protein
MAASRASGSRWGAAEPVRTNQRALIDKILARYCTDYSVYRELIQNSNDASATQAQVCFSTAPVAQAAGGVRRVVTEVVYRNNGAPFSDADWSRLTCIADGNPSPGMCYVGFNILDNEVVAIVKLSLILFELFPRLAVTTCQRRLGRSVSARTHCSR